MSEPTQRSSKRRSLLSGLDELTATRPTPERSTAPLGHATAEIRPDHGRGSRVAGKTRRTSVYLPAATLRALKELALARDCKVNDLLVEGAVVVLRQNGHPSSYACGTS